MDEQISWFKALADPTRMRLLAALARGDLSVTDLTLVVRQSQPRVSRHLKLLTDAGLIERFKEGAWVFYRLAAHGPASRFVTMSLGFLPDDDSQLRRDADRIAAVRAERAADAERYFAAHADDWNALRTLGVSDTAVEAALLSALPEGPIDTLIDIGTGTGRVLEITSGRVRDSLGVDISREMLSVARSRLAAAGCAACQVRLGDMYALPVASGSQKAAILHQVLHFAEDPAGAIREAARTLAPGGRLVIADLAPHDREDLRADHAHRRLGFSTEAVNGWMTSAGLAPAPPRTVPGPALTVVVWSADKLEGHHP